MSPAEATQDDQPPSSVESAEARTEHALAQLFAAARIERILCVDDVFAADSEALIGLLAGFTPEQRARVFDSGVERFAEEEVWQERVREEWERRSEHECASLVDKAYAIDAGVDPVSTGAIHALRGVLPDELAPQGLSLSEWREQKEQLIGGLHETPTLILFDQNFSHEGASEKEGERLIGEMETVLDAAESDLPVPVYYGLLTNTVSAEDEHQRRQQIVNEAGLDPRRLVVISKRNLDYEELERFAKRLRTTLLAPTLAGLTHEVTSQLQAEQQAAIVRAEGIPPEEMERIVMLASDREGDWPPDTLVRVLSAMQRTKVREQLRTAPRVQELTRRLRNITAIASPTATPTVAVLEEATSTQASLASPQPHPVAAGILREEIYDDAEHVNGLHLPIELGDVIERPSGGQLWVVVAQPCALMVRPKGEREPELTHTTLAKLRRREPGQEMLFNEFELPYFDPEGDTDVIVQLGRAAYPRAVIVDSCVLNDDGSARLDLGTEPAAELLPHWRARQGELKKIADMLFTRIEKTEIGELDDKAVVGHYKGDPFAPVHVDREAKCIQWDCRRVGRVGEPYARALLTRFSQYTARDAYLSDLAR